jgi:hypothetical protein
MVSSKLCICGPGRFPVQIEEHKNFFIGIFCVFF